MRKIHWLDFRQSTGRRGSKHGSSPRLRASVVRFSVFGLALTLAGCLVPEKPPTSFYVLNSLEQAEEAQQSRQGPLIEISEVTLPPYLERSQIVTRPTPNRLELAELHRWSDDLRDLITHTLAKNLAALLDTPQILVAPHRSRAQPDHRLSLEVGAFELAADGQVHLDAAWSWTGSADSAVPTAESTMLRSEPLRIPEDGDMEAIVAAMNGLLDQLSRQIARSLPSGG